VVHFGREKIRLILAWTNNAFNGDVLVKTIIVSLKFNCLHVTHALYTVGILVVDVLQIVREQSQIESVKLALSRSLLDVDG
jgi:hypothetical protein